MNGWTYNLLFQLGLKTPETTLRTVEESYSQPLHIRKMTKLQKKPKNEKQKQAKMSEEAKPQQQLLKISKRDFCAPEFQTKVHNDIARLQALEQRNPSGPTGTWTCHACGGRHINTFIVIPSINNPLGHMSCGECGHAACHLCQMPRELIEPWSPSGKEIWCEGESSRGVLPIVHVCRKCGLSWRAVITKTKKIKGVPGKEKANWGPLSYCVCGEPSGKREVWDAFLILVP